MLSSRLGGTLIFAHRNSGLYKMCYVTLYARCVTSSPPLLLATTDLTHSAIEKSDLLRPLRRLNKHPAEQPHLTQIYRFYSHLKKPTNLQVNSTTTTTALRGKEIFKNALELRKEQLLEKRDVFVKDMRKTKSRVRERVKEKMEEIVERENVMTVPNLLCVGRAALSPYLAYVVIQQDYRVAMGVLMFAGLTDLVRFRNMFFFV